MTAMARAAKQPIHPRVDSPRAPKPPIVSGTGLQASSAAAGTAARRTRKRKRDEEDPGQRTSQRAGIRMGMTQGRCVMGIGRVDEWPCADGDE